jgi:demethylmenaquinone methyltransferase/2-methoxy-6-polyprenyl-1,4-benzoquinol methylase
MVKTTPQEISPSAPASSPAWDENLLQSPHTVADKRRRVQQMFAAIAPSYDLNNRLHSLWMDQAWRRKAVKLASLKATDHVIDVACGTGDLTLKFATALNRIAEDAAPPTTIGIDFTFEMLPIARRKSEDFTSHGRSRRFSEEEMLARHRILGSSRQYDLSTLRFFTKWINGDAQALPLPDQSADVVSIAFGIRNVADTAAAIGEFYRVLRPGGRLVILEFSLPTNPLLRGLYNFYFRQILPRTATLISGDKTGAYKYLPQSVNTFIGRKEMMQMMSSAGFVDVQQFPMTFGVCVCYRGTKS